MGYEADLGQTQGYGGDIGPPPEAAPAYAEFGHAALVDLFSETHGDPNIGVELSVRLLAHAGLAGDPTTAPLIGRDGVQVVHDGKPLMLADYVNYAAAHHFDQLEGILDFLIMVPGDPDYEAMRTTMLDRLSAGRR